MTEKQTATTKEQMNNKQGSGTNYHEEHASHVPDYGGNIVDPNATDSIVSEEK